MHISKYITAVICIFLAAIMNIMINANAFPYAVPHEYRVDILDNMEKTSLTRMNSVADKHNVMMYSVIPEQTSMNEMVVTIYTASENEEKIWKDHLGVKPGIVRDITGKKVYLRMGNLSSLDKSSTLKERARIVFLAGSNDDCSLAVREIKSELDYDIKGSPARYSIESLLSFLISGLAFLVLLVFCYIDSSYEKKEISVRVIHGDSASVHYLRICLRDVIVFSLIFLTGYIFQNKYTQILRYYNNQKYIFIIFIVLLCLVNSHILTIRSKELLYGHAYSHKLLVMLKLLGSAAAVICSLLLVISASYIPSIAEYKRAAAFFDQHKDYAFIDLVHNAGVDEMMLKDDRYNDWVMKTERAFDNDNDDLFQEIIINEIENRSLSDTPRIYCNHRALSYIKSVISEAEWIDLDTKDAVILFPDTYDMASGDEEIARLADMVRSYEGYTIEKDNIQVIQYAPVIDVMYFSSMYDSKFTFHKTPIIYIVSDTYKKTGADKLTMNHFLLRSGALFRITDREMIRKMAEEKPFTPVITNAYEQYKKEYDSKIVLLLIFAGVGVLIIAFYVSILRIILQLDYMINAVELAVKKTTGYSVFEKNLNNFSVTIITGIINIAVTLIYTQKTGSINVGLAVLVPVILMLLNLLLIYYMIITIEKQKISTILKGGAL